MPTLNQVDWVFYSDELEDSIIIRWLPPLRVVAEFSDGQLIGESIGSSAETLEEALCQCNTFYPKAKRIATA